MTVVRTRSGRVRGLTRDGVHVFKGIPYAMPPFGPRRFRPPRPVEPWDGVREATESGPTAPQPEFPMPPEADGFYPVVRGEDCLNLNVWSAGLGAAGLPVMVWLHGGGTEGGSALLYDGTAFARDGVVLVTVHYRLGVEGLLHLGDGPANLTLLDQVAALEWARDDIAAFGGDPGNVTVFGESSGAMFTGALLAMPRARGLFRRAIMQSGAGNLACTPETARHVGGVLAEVLGVPPTLEAIAAVPVERALEAHAAVMAMLARHPDPRRWNGEPGARVTAWQPVVDGDTLPGRPLDLIGPGADVMVGSNAEEGRLSLVPFVPLSSISEEVLVTAMELYGLPVGEALARPAAVRPAHRPGAAGGAVPRHARRLGDVRRARRPGLARLRPGPAAGDALRGRVRSGARSGARVARALGSCLLSPWSRGGIVGGGWEDGAMTDTPPHTVIADSAAYAEAVQLAVDANAAYYGAGESALDDDAYDRLFRGIQAYEAAHPDEVLPDSPTGKVAGGAVVGDVPHTVPMLSLDNVFSAEQLAKWVAGLERRLGRPVAAFSVEPKLDGMAVSARYHAGRLVQLVTRGDGTAGEDVSHGIGTITGLPRRLSRPVTVEIRGEVLMTAEQFDEACAKRLAHDGTTFANPRSAAAGTLRAKDRPYVCELTFFGYSALPLPPDDDSELAASLRELPHSEIMELVAGLGVATTAATPVAGIVATTVERIQERVGEVAAARATLPFGIDGIVIKADTAADQAEAGFGTRAPRWAIAYKLPATEKITKLIGVEWAVGRTGIIAPRAVLEPVELDGSTVTYATLHNPADIARRGLMLGDHVMVHKAGDVIPRVEAPVVHLRTGEETEIAFPESCPHCQGEIDRSQERWRCVQGRACRAVASILYAAGRDQLDIETLAENRIVQLLDAGLIIDFADLFTLTRDQILGLDRMGETSTDKLLAALDQARARPLSRVFCALGVRGTGRSMSRRIARHFGTMDAILAADVEAVQQVDGMGPEKATLLVAELEELRPLIAKLVAAGVNMTEPGVTGAGSSSEAPELPLTGKTVVVTGAMTGELAALSRNQMNELIERAGGKSSSSVSAKTSLLVAGEKAGSKRAKAESLGITVISPDEFATLIADHLTPTT